MLGRVLWHTMLETWRASCILLFGISTVFCVHLPEKTCEFVHCTTWDGTRRLSCARYGRNFKNLCSKFVIKINGDKTHVIPFAKKRKPVKLSLILHAPRLSHVKRVFQIPWHNVRKRPAFRTCIKTVRDQDFRAHLLRILNLLKPSGNFTYDQV
jgi:hypothetical protein